MQSNQDPMKVMIAGQMAEMLGSCKACKFAADSLDKCEDGKNGRPEFKQRFSETCIHLEYDNNWCE